MRRIALVLSLALALFGTAMFAGSVSSRANNHRPLDAHIATNSGIPQQSEMYGWNGDSITNDDLDQDKEAAGDEAEDPDMPKGRRVDIDEKTYMRLRDEYIARRRGLEPGRPFDPEARGHAIQQMQVQEALQGETNKRLRLLLRHGYRLVQRLCQTEWGPCQ